MITNNLFINIVTLVIELRFAFAPHAATWGVFYSAYLIETLFDWMSIFYHHSIILSSVKLLYSW